jgi:hypothetical protein
MKNSVTKKEIAEQVVLVQTGLGKEIGTYQIDINGLSICNWQSKHHAAVVSFPEGNHDTALTTYEKEGVMLTATTKKEFVDAVYYIQNK